MTPSGRVEPGLPQQRDRFLRIEWQRLDVQVITPAPGRERTGDDRPLAVEERIQHLLPVHGIGERLAHAFVRQQQGCAGVAEKTVGQGVVRLHE